MASGTGNLPNQNMDFTPFDILTAEEMDDLVENIESLADGTGIGDGSVTANTLAQSAKSQFKVGVLPASTFSVVGNKSITGVGFKPKLVRFTVLPPLNNANGSGGGGTMGEGGNQYATYSVAGTNTLRNSAQDRCVFYLSTSTSYLMSASYVSMDADGFTINIHNASSTFDIAYEAYY